MAAFWDTSIKKKILTNIGRSLRHFFKKNLLANIGCSLGHFYKKIFLVTIKETVLTNKKKCPRKYKKSILTNKKKLPSQI